MGFKKRYQNIIEKFLSGDQGKRFFQVFYSLGAAVIIIGVLAKLMHWPYGLGNILLYVGFITEAIVFTISAFDHPAKDWQWDRVFPVLDTNDEEDRPAFGGSNGGGSVVIGSGVAGESTGVIGGAAAGGAGNGVSGPVIIGGGGFVGGGNGGALLSASETVQNLTPGQVVQSFGIPSAVNISEEETGVLSESIRKMASAADQLSKISDVLLESYRNIADNTEGLSSSSQNYAEQMEVLNRNIQGLSAFYELQLKTVSSQIESIERINAGLTRIREMYEGSVLDSSLFRSETEKMTQQIHALNGVYNRLLNAMTMNMYGNGFNPNPYNNNPQNNL
ncbi:MAG: gliding motility protein GldL [Dysgonamonadaceae bacterium]|jgi:hypothetical protein|nr:gliding motility protein GldL [Dysgonamonadaceae bacterium]